jgi:hypothetical protein
MIPMRGAGRDYQLAEDGRDKNTLPFDTTRCDRRTCSIRMKCLRFTAPGHPRFQSYAKFEGGKLCSAFIPGSEE